ncbi:PDZ domain-containing protein 8-like [Lampetra fluviatilis]
MFYVIVFSALFGIVFTFMLEVFIYYRLGLKPVPAKSGVVGPSEPTASPRPGGGEARGVPGAQGQGQVTSSPDGLGAGGEPPPGTPESCDFLNVLFLFLFRELRDTGTVRRWLIKKIRVEFVELLQSKTVGRLIEGLSLRDVSLGDTLPVFSSVVMHEPDPVPEKNVPEQLDLEVDVEYSGGFHLAVDVDLVFGKSAYLFVRVARVAGRVRLRFSHLPFTHWSFAFIREPELEFDVESRLEGRPLPQLTAIIERQLRSAICRKHTLPNYKVRSKPFFPVRVVPRDIDLCMQDSKLSEGRLKVALLECSRLYIPGSQEREVAVHCTLELSAGQWKERERSAVREVEIVKVGTAPIGLTFRQTQSTDGESSQVLVEAIAANSPAASANIRRGERLVTIGGTKVATSSQASKLIKQAGERVIISLERTFGGVQPPPGSASGPLPHGMHVTDGSAIIPDDDSSKDTVSLGSVESNDARDGDSDVGEGECGDGFPESLRSKEEPPLSLLSAPPTKDEAPQPPSTASPSKRRTMATLGSISPILSRRLQQSSPLRSLHKGYDAAKGGSTTPAQSDGEKVAPSASAKPGTVNQSGRPPPIPPRPQLRATSSAPLGSLQSPGETGDASTLKPTDKGGSMEQVEQEKLGDATDSGAVGTSGLACAEECTDELRVTQEMVYHSNRAVWPARAASHTFDVESHHRSLTVAVWRKDPLKPDSLRCLGYASVPLMEIAAECLATASYEHEEVFPLSAPEPRATANRTAMRNANAKEKQNLEQPYYGDVRLRFAYWVDEGGDGLTSSSTTNVDEDRDLFTRAEEIGPLPAGVRDWDSGPPAAPPPPLSPLPPSSGMGGAVRHSFCDTQFQNPTYCDYCKKKVWTKAATQCSRCAYVCHKKCQERCLEESESGRCMPRESRDGAREGGAAGSGGAAPGSGGGDPPARLSNLKQSVAMARSRLTLAVPRPLRQAGSRLRASEEVVVGPTQSGGTSDNESSDNEGGSSGSAAGPTGQPSAASLPGRLEDSVYLAVKEIGREIFRGMPAEERRSKLEQMLDKLQQEVEAELEQRNSLEREERQACAAGADAKKVVNVTHSLRKSTERLQALTLLSIHYRAGMEEEDQPEVGCVPTSGPSSAHRLPQPPQAVSSVLTQPTPDVPLRPAESEQFYTPQEPSLFSSPPRDDLAVIQGAVVEVSGAAWEEGEAEEAFAAASEVCEDPGEIVFALDVEEDDEEV